MDRGHDWAVIVAVSAVGMALYFVSLGYGLGWQP